MVPSDPTGSLTLHPLARLEPCNRSCRPAVLGTPRTLPFGAARIKMPKPGRWHQSGRNPRVEPAFRSPIPAGFLGSPERGHRSQPDSSANRCLFHADRSALAPPPSSRMLLRAPCGLIASGPVSALPTQRLAASRPRLLPAPGSYPLCGSKPSKAPHGEGLPPVRPDFPSLPDGSSCDSCRRINVPGPLPFPRLTAHQTSWNQRHYSAGRGECQLFSVPKGRFMHRYIPFRIMNLST